MWKRTGGTEYFLPSAKTNDSEGCKKYLEKDEVCTQANGVTVRLSIVDMDQRWKNGQESTGVRGPRWSEHGVPTLPIEFRRATLFFEKLQTIAFRDQQPFDQGAARLGVLAVRLDVAGEETDGVRGHAIMLT